MGNILEFPSQQAQGLAFLDQQLRARLTERGADEQLIDFAANQLTRTYERIQASEQYNCHIKLPAGLSTEQEETLRQNIGQELEGIRRDNHALVLELVAELVLAQVRLFQHERDG